MPEAEVNAPVETPETVPASEAVLALTAQVMKNIGVEVNELSALALRDAKLDPKDGWRYDPQNGVYVKQ